MHSEASIQDRERTQNHTNEDLDVFSLQKSLPMLEGLSLTKRLMIVFCDLMQEGLKATELMKKFQLNKSKS